MEEVNFKLTPGEYYLTKRGELIFFDNNEKIVVGKLVKMTDKEKSEYKQRIKNIKEK